MSGSSKFPGFENFYELRIGLSDRAYRAKISMNGVDELGFMRGEGPFDREFSARWAMGGRVPSDFVGTTLATPVIISQRVRDLLESEGFTGWVTHPCRVFGRDGEPYDHHLLGITGRCGPMNYSRSEVFTKLLPGGPTTYLRGEYFDESTWDGSDFVLAGKTVTKIITERVRGAFIKHKLRNITMPRLTEVEFGALEVGLKPPRPTVWNNGA